jgi:Cu(I)/Ag(I) efflux system membrane fusion protein
MTLARINGLATVWIEAAVPERRPPRMRPGRPAQVRLAALPGEVLQARIVAAVLPEATSETRTLRVRIELPNPRPAPAGRHVCAGHAQGPEAGDAAGGAQRGRHPHRPPRAGLRGRRPGRFRPVEVQMGRRGRRPTRGAKRACRRTAVVASGQFLIDSEASLQGVHGRAPAGAGRPAAMEYPATNAFTVAA